MKFISPNLINILSLQVGWWGTTLSYPNQYFFIPLTAILLLIHFIYNNFRTKELTFIIIGCFVGCLFDYIAMSIGLWSPKDPYVLFPVWLICYWLVFLTSFSLSLNWLLNKPLITFVLGFLAGPLTYYAGEKFSILHFNALIDESTFYSFLIYGLIWGTNYLILFKIYKAIKK